MNAKSRIQAERLCYERGLALSAADKLRRGVAPETYEEYRAMWALMSEPQRERIRAKCRWEHMTTWAVCIEWAGIWNDTPANLRRERERLMVGHRRRDA